MKNLDEAPAVGIINLFGELHSGGSNGMAPPETGSAPSADAALVRGLRSEDPRVLQDLMGQYWEPLVGFAQRIMVGAGDPEDMVQTAFVRLWARREKLDEAGSLKSLLYTIVRNACLDELRKQGRRRKAHQAASQPPPPKTPYEDVQGAELHRLAAAAVSRLPERRREVFRLVREEGLAYQEVAEIMGLSPQTVANHMSLAMADLRTALRPYVTDRGTEEEETSGNAGDRERADG
jgi:RNA polymerase sigma-70 factor (ECF subfamily)